MISKELNEALKLHFKLKGSVGVDSEHPYVFAIPSGGSKTYIRCDTLIKHVQLCNLEILEAICSLNGIKLWVFFGKNHDKEPLVLS